MAAKPKFSSTPASVIYAQSWPDPTANSTFSQRYPAKANSNSQKKGINSSWICKPKQHTTRPQKVASPTHKPHSWASSMLSNNYPGWLENDGQVMLDMAKEFKITLQMFKRLTEQVKEVDEQLNLGRKQHSFKHYFSNRKSGPRRMRNYTPEIPMTNEAYQPCTNLGSKTKQPRPHSQYEAYRKTDKSFSNTSKSRLETWPLSYQEKPKTRNWQAQEVLDDKNNHENWRSRFQNGDDRSGRNLNYDDRDTQWNNCLEFSDEENHVGLGYIDPVPQYWEERKLEELEMEFSPEKSGGDPFMARYLQLRRLEIETVEQEKRNRKIEENGEPCLDCGLSRNTVTNKGKKSTSKKQSAKGNEVKGAVEKVEKNPRRVLKKSSQSASSLHELKKLGVRNYGKEIRNGVKVSDKESKDSRTSKDKKQTVRTESKSAKGKRRAQSCKGRPVSYSSSVTYDILELAASFDPPGKERIKLNPRPVTAKSAKTKGMLPGKTWFSQRRFSLTAGQSLQSLPSDSSDPVISKSRTSSAKKSGKRSAKRCNSSKL